MHIVAAIIMVFFANYVWGFISPSDSDSDYFY